jgi:hypothetical protein
MLRKTNRNVIKMVRGLLDIFWLSDSDQSRSRAYTSLLSHRYSIPRALRDEIEVIGESYGHERF